MPNRSKTCRILLSLALALSCAGLAQAQAQSVNQLLGAATAAERRAEAIRLRQERAQQRIDSRNQQQQSRLHACDTVGRWLQDPRVGPTLNRPPSGQRPSDADLLLLLDGPVFEDAFGRPYAQMSPTDLQAYPRLLASCFNSVGPLATLDTRAKMAALQILNPHLMQRNLALTDRARKAGDSLAEISDELARLQPIPADYERMNKLLSAAAPSLAKMPAGQKAQFEQAVSAAEERVAIPVERQRTEAALAASPGPDSLAALAPLSEQLARRSASPAVTSARERNRTLLADKIKSLLGAMVVEQKARIDGFGSGLPGLTKGVEWSDQFRSRYETMKPRPNEVATVAAYFMERRQGQLEQARAPFARELERAATPEQAHSLTRRYLIEADKSTPAGAQLWKAAQLRGDAIVKWTVLGSDPERDRRAPKSLDGEPTEGEMYDAFNARLRGAASLTRDLAEGCNNLKNGTSADAIACLLGGATKMAGGDQPMSIDQFEKVGCARANGRYGYACDFKAAYSGGVVNAQTMGRTLADMARRPGRISGLFSRDKAGWWSMENLDKD